MIGPVHKLILMLAIAGNTALVVPASAADVRGDFLAESCTEGIEKGNEAGYSFCLGFVIATIQTRAFMRLYFEDVPLQFCSPDTATHGEYMEVVVKYIEDNPSLQGASAALSVLLALSDAYPCP